MQDLQGHRVHQGLYDHPEHCVTATVVLGRTLWGSWIGDSGQGQWRPTGRRLILELGVLKGRWEKRRGFK